MTQRFAQQSNIPVAIGFAGLILISQLMVFNMGYQMPWYFLAVLGILCLFIVWGLVANDLIIQDQQLNIKAGPFKNIIQLKDINRLSVGRKPFLKNARTPKRLEIHYGNKKKMIVHPEDRTAFVNALSSQLPKLNISEELKV